MRTRFGTSARQAKECLLGLRRDPQGSVLDLAMEIWKLVNLAHPSTHVNERELLVIDYLIRAMSNTSSYNAIC